ncbi:hypothetical protein SAMN02982917_3932 [Azospirillum oryzae]|uniref:Uncharacterized protein n=1 Tax=Azospirillum oryzae TaxID=286727 RepID=A0A1X7GJJ9_9PROT|nr:hypothetical protein SAMN02982917_3932 [Azospirillum oryzae]
MCVPCQQPLRQTLTTSATTFETGCKQPGIYLIRQIGQTYLHYVGQTGSGTMTLRKRLAMLSGVYGDEMPYRDPHTAAPALWAELHRTGQDYEALTVPLPGMGTPLRKGMEALVIAVHRQEFGFSPRMNFGRMPPGYRMSSGNTRRLETVGKRYRGGLTSDLNQSHTSGVDPTGPLVGNVSGPDWVGLTWSGWFGLSTLSTASMSSTTGVYRIRRRGEAILTYIGQGIIAKRICAHLAKAKATEHRQAALFSDPAALEVSFATDLQWLPHQRLEIENDLIASHLLVTGKVPYAQFIG